MFFISDNKTEKMQTLKFQTKVLILIFLAIKKKS